MKQFFEKNFITYQMAILIVFLFFVTLTKSLDMALPFYIVFSALPYLKSLARLPDWFAAVFFIVSAGYLAYGLIFQDQNASLVAFCSRLFQFLVLFWFYKNRVTFSGRIKTEYLLIAVILVETVLGGYLLMTGDMTFSNGLIRTVAGNQPVGGNCAIAVVPILIYVYFHKESKRNLIIIAGFILLLWVVISGTRGYLLLFVLSLFPVYIHYCVTPEQSRESGILKCVIVLAFIAIILILFFLRGDVFKDEVVSVFRLNEGIGRRTLENQIAVQTFQTTTWRYRLVGMGLGGTAADVWGYAHAVADAWGNTWGYMRYISAVGVSFHCLYTNVLLLMGIFGLSLIGFTFVWGCMRIHQCRYAFQLERICLLLFWIGFFIMNFYRWSCDCGITEMIIFAYVLNQLTFISDAAR